MMLVNAELDVNWYQRIMYISRLQTSLVQLIFDGTAKSKFDILVPEKTLIS